MPEDRYELTVKKYTRVLNPDRGKRPTGGYGEPDDREFIEVSVPYLTVTVSQREWEVIKQAVIEIK